MLKKIKNIPDKYCWTVILSSLAIAAGIILYYIPPDMDVFNQYHALACWHYPNSVLHSFREPCDDGLKLKLFGDISWWRSYRYVGATYSMLYYPLFLLWPSRYSVTILCVLVMALGIFAASRLLKIQLWIATLLLAATFPIFFYTIYDYGQLTLQLCLLYALPYLASKIVVTPTRRSWIFLSIASGLLIALGVESKPVFLYFVPSIAIITIAACLPPRPKAKHLALLVKQLWLGIFTAATLIFVLLNSVTTKHMTYYHDLVRRVPLSKSANDILSHLKELLQSIWFDFPNIATVVYSEVDRPINMYAGKFNWDKFLVTMPFWLCALVMCSLYAYHHIAARKIPDSTRMLGALVAATIVGLLIVAIDQHSWAGHHILQPLYFLLGALAILMQFIWQHYRRVGIIMMALLLTSNISSAIYTASQKPAATHDWGRIQVLDFITEHNLASRTVINHTDWGIYYISSLYGPKEQLVMFEAPTDSVVETAKKLRRNVLFVTYGKESLPPEAEKIPNMRCVFSAQNGNPKRPWQVWTDTPIHEPTSYP